MYVHKRVYVRIISSAKSPIFMWGLFALFWRGIVSSFMYIASGYCSSVSFKIKKGFTLLELLVVISIIGIMATVIMTAMSQSRSKSRDAVIKQDLAKVRTQAALYADGFGGGKYGTVGWNSADCPPAGGSSMFRDALIQPLIAEIQARANGGGAEVECRALPLVDPTVWAVSARINVPSAGAYWCADNTGASKQIGAGLALSDTTC